MAVDGMAAGKRAKGFLPANGAHNGALGEQGKVDALRFGSVTAPATRRGQRAG